MASISKDTPLSEITLRKYEKPSGNRHAMIRKLCLSIGLLQPGDSRDIIVEILEVLLDAKKKKKLLHSEEIQKNVVLLRKKMKLPLRGVASSNIRRQLKRLRDVFIVEKFKNLYRITEFESMEKIFDERIERYYLKSIVERVGEYFKGVN